MEWNWFQIARGARGRGGLFEFSLKFTPPINTNTNKTSFKYKYAYKYKCKKKQMKTDEPKEMRKQ